MLANEKKINNLIAILPQKTLAFEAWLSAIFDTPNILTIKAIWPEFLQYLIVSAKLTNRKGISAIFIVDSLSKLV